VTLLEPGESYCGYIERIERFIGPKTRAQQEPEWYVIFRDGFVLAANYKTRCNIKKALLGRSTLFDFEEVRGLPYLLVVTRNPAQFANRLHITYSVERQD
jgi:hypothetical protein